MLFCTFISCNYANFTPLSVIYPFCLIVVNNKKAPAVNRGFLIHSLNLFNYMHIKLAPVFSKKVKPEIKR